MTRTLIRLRGCSNFRMITANFSGVQKVCSKTLNNYGITIKIWTPEKFVVIILKFEQSGLTVVKCIKKMQMERQTV